MPDNKLQSEMGMAELVAEVNTQAAIEPKRSKKGRVVRVNPKSLKNLKHIKPGQVLNPSGSRKTKDRQLLKLSNEEMNRLTSLLLQSTQSDIQSIRDNPNSTMLELALASIASKIVEQGDARALETLINRPLGKPTETINVNNSNTAPQVIITLPSNQREVLEVTPNKPQLPEAGNVEPLTVPKPKLLVRYGPKNG